MDVDLDLSNVERLETSTGTSFTTRVQMSVLLDSLRPEDAGDVSVVFKSGVRTSLAKLVASQGDEAVRVDGTKGYL